MLTEHKFRQQLAAAWRSVGTPIRKTRRLLRLSQRAKSLGGALMELGFVKHREGDHSRSRQFWAAAATMLSLSQTARKQAKQALNGKSEPAPSFETTPRGLAVPAWERHSTLEVAGDRGPALAKNFGDFEREGGLML